MRNKRLRELKLAVYITHIDKASNKYIYNKLIKVLHCVAVALGHEEAQSFTEFVKKTVNSGFLGATDKEIIATHKKYFSVRKFIKRLNISCGTFYNRYGDLLDRDFITDDFLNSLQPVFESEKETFMIEFMMNFIERFKFELGNDNHDLKDNERTLELEFYLIYEKLINIFRNAGVCDKFIFNVCNVLDIEYSTIAHLKNNIHIINRSYPNFRYNNRYLMQELVTLYTHKGLTKGAIGSKVLGKTSSYLYNNTNKKFDVMSEDDMSWQYTPTLDWSSIKKDEVKKFIDLFHLVINYDI